MGSRLLWGRALGNVLSLLLMSVCSAVTSDFEFDGPGPYSWERSSDVQLQVPDSTGCKDSQCSAIVSLTVPMLPAGKDSKEVVAVAVLSPGFLVAKESYNSYAERFASWGIATVQWQPGSETMFDAMTHETLAHFLPWLIAFAKDQLGDRIPDLPEILLVGHSRGAKISFLAAASGLVLPEAIMGLDPVDKSSFDKEDVSVLPLMGHISAPTLIVGSELGNVSMMGQSCAPTGSNYASFFESSRSPTWSLEIFEAGHMQFLDPCCASCISCLVMKKMCAAGSQSDSVVQEVAKTAAVAWIHYVSVHVKS
mmetsp:Transcript_49167/g.76707  ORF Transcript_49167/g.76707 Transcript_49167/m.76707 type:complete len:309 (+) Transcript_49167:537-1463(+)